MAIAELKECNLRQAVTEVIPGINDQLSSLAQEGELLFAPGEQFRVLHALEQVAHDHPELGIDATAAALLTTPARKVIVPLRVEFGGETYLCQAVRGQFHDGKYHPPFHITKGGIRFIGVEDRIQGKTHMVADEPRAAALMDDDVRALGLAMLVKNAGVDFRNFMSETGITALDSSLEELDVVGGSKGVIVGPRDPHLPDHDRFIWEVLREYGRVFTLNSAIGADRDVPAGDQNTTGSVDNQSVMDGLVEGHAQALKEMGFDLPGNIIAGVVTGKSPDHFGHPTRGKATGFGTIEALKAWAEAAEVDLEEVTVVIDGAGNAALPAAKSMMEMGARVVGLTDSRSVIYLPAGLTTRDLEGIRSTKQGRGSLADFARETGGRAEIITQVAANLEQGKQELWQRSDMHVLFLSSGERVLNIENVHALPEQCGVVVDGANGGGTPLAEKVLKENGVDHLTGAYANAGGVIVSLIEWAGNCANIQVTPEMAEKAVANVMQRNLREMFRLVREHKVESLEEAFYYLAILRYLTPGRNAQQ